MRDLLKKDSSLFFLLFLHSFDVTFHFDVGGVRQKILVSFRGHKAANTTESNERDTFGLGSFGSFKYNLAFDFTTITGTIPMQEEMLLTFIFYDLWVH